MDRKRFDEFVDYICKCNYEDKTATPCDHNSMTKDVLSFCGRMAREGLWREIQAMKSGVEQIPVSDMVKDFKQWLDNVTSWPELAEAVEHMSSDIEKNRGGTLHGK